jgi:hypothetical protein
MAEGRSSYVTFEEPDIVFWHLIGNVEERDITRIYDAQMEFCRGKSHVFVLIDVSQMKSMTPAARRAAAAGPIPGKKVMPVRGCAVIGASFHIQVLGLLVTKAARVLNPQEDNVIHYCDTEAQGRVWIDKRRGEVLAGLK